ncbi:MAG TPA: hypothetical protein VHF01_06430 [Candidatus Acidoferrum sp.]|nr:hypothetical protein [Candidatus Acidoferrum sp.]
MEAAKQDKVQSATANRRFGFAWVAFALAFGLHFTDEATHDFLAFYNHSARAIRARLSFLPVPTFTFPVWLSLLIAAFVLLLCQSPFAFRGNRGLRAAAWPLGVLVGIANAPLHTSSSIYFHRWMPGVYSSPLLMAAAIYLLVAVKTPH